MLLLHKTTAIIFNVKFMSTERGELERSVIALKQPK